MMKDRKQKREKRCKREGVAVKYKDKLCPSKDYLQHMTDVISSFCKGL